MAVNHVTAIEFRRYLNCQSTIRQRGFGDGGVRTRGGEVAAIPMKTDTRPSRIARIAFTVS